MNITTAVIPVAGAGSRMLPATSAIEKCMLPVYANGEARPNIDYMVEDCVGAGISRIIFVCSERGRAQLKDYFGPELPPTLRTQLERLGKTDIIDAELSRRSSYGVSFEYVIQPTDVYGTSVPPYAAKSLLDNESHFVVMGGDDFVYHADGTSELAQAIAHWRRSGADHAVMGLPIDREDCGKYGILQTDNNGLLKAIDEKPPRDRWPQEPVANISRYILSADIWPFIDAEMATARGTAEHYITYPIDAAAAAGQSFYVHPVTGKYLDGGSPAGIAEAGRYIELHPPVQPLSRQADDLAALRN